MAVTSIDIDPDILRGIKDAYGFRTNEEALDFALRESLMRARQLAAIDAIAALDLDPHPRAVASGS